MKRTIFALLAVVALAVGNGCARNACSGGSEQCSEVGGRPTLFGRRDAGMEAAGPPAAQVAYPYYTVRGPRDYFCDKPM